MLLLTITGKLIQDLFRQGYKLFYLEFQQLLCCFILTNCVVPEDVHIHGMDGHWKFQRGRGSQKPNFLRGCMNQTGNSRGVQGPNQKAILGLEIWIFSGTTLCELHRMLKCISDIQLLFAVQKCILHVDRNFFHVTLALYRWQWHHRHHHCCHHQ